MIDLGKSSLSIRHSHTTTGTAELITNNFKGGGTIRIVPLTDPCYIGTSKATAEARKDVCPANLSTYVRLTTDAVIWIDGSTGGVVLINEVFEH